MPELSKMPTWAQHWICDLPFHWHGEDGGPALLGCSHSEAGRGCLSQLRAAVEHRAGAAQMADGRSSRFWRLESGSQTAPHEGGEITLVAPLVRAPMPPWGRTQDLIHLLACQRPPPDTVIAGVLSRGTS